MSQQRARQLASRALTGPEKDNLRDPDSASNLGLTRTAPHQPTRLTLLHRQARITSQTRLRSPEYIRSTTIRPIKLGRTARQVSGEKQLHGQKNSVINQLISAGRHFLRQLGVRTCVRQHTGSEEVSNVTVCMAKTRYGEKSGLLNFQTLLRSLGT